jgi:hypothetical protein
MKQFIFAMLAVSLLLFGCTGVAGPQTGAEDKAVKAPQVPQQANPQEVAGSEAQAVQGSPQTITPPEVQPSAQPTSSAPAPNTVPAIAESDTARWCPAGEYTDTIQQGAAAQGQSAKGLRYKIDGIEQYAGKTMCKATASLDTGAMNIPGMPSVTMVQYFDWKMMNGMEGGEMYIITAGQNPIKSVLTSKGLEPVLPN